MVSRKSLTNCLFSADRVRNIRLQCEFFTVFSFFEVVIEKNVTLSLEK